MTKKEFRSDCPIASILDIIGDKWSVIVVRDLLMGKTTFKEMSESKERIASNILSTRLKLLSHYGIISKRKLPSNKKENVYLLTEKGIELVPLLYEAIIWSDRHIRPYNPE